MSVMDVLPFGLGVLGVVIGWRVSRLDEDAAELEENRRWARARALFGKAPL